MENWMRPARRAHVSQEVVLMFRRAFFESWLNQQASLQIRGNSRWKEQDKIPIVVLSLLAAFSLKHKRQTYLFTAVEDLVVLFVALGVLI